MERERELRLNSTGGERFKRRTQQECVVVAMVVSGEGGGL
jgi:hypothetical protein